MASWAPSEGEALRVRGARFDLGRGVDNPKRCTESMTSLSESAYYACPGPCR